MPRRKKAIDISDIEVLVIFHSMGDIEKEVYYELGMMKGGKEKMTLSEYIKATLSEISDPELQIQARSKLLEKLLEW